MQKGGSDIAVLPAFGLSACDNGVVHVFGESGWGTIVPQPLHWVQVDRTAVVYIGRMLRSRVRGAFHELADAQNCVSFGVSDRVNVIHVAVCSHRLEGVNPSLFSGRVAQHFKRCVVVLVADRLQVDRSSCVMIRKA